MKTITIAFIAAIIAMTSIAIYAKEGFTSPSVNKLMYMCFSEDSFIEYENNKDGRYLLRQNGQCVTFETKGIDYQFELEAYNQYYAKIRMYDGNGQLTDKSVYVSTTSLARKRDTAAKDFLSSLTPTSNPTPPPPPSNTISMPDDQDPDNFIICSSYDAMQYVKTHENDVPRTCSFGAQERKAILHQVKGDVIEVSFVYENNEESEKYWIAKEAFSIK